VAEQTGAGLADALDRVAEGLMAEREIVDEIEGQLAGPRATARLLVVLPLFALLLGRTLGADPIGVLLRTTYGWVCLAVGLALLAIGWRWTHAQVRRVSPWPDR
jgi:tight adherence protein B